MDWLPILISMGGVILTGATTVAVVASRVGKMEQKIAGNMLDIDRNSIRIKLLESETIASGIQLSVIKGDLGYIRVKIDTHLAEDMAFIKDRLNKITRDK